MAISPSSWQELGPLLDTDRERTPVIGERGTEDALSVMDWLDERADRERKARVLDGRSPIRSGDVAAVIDAAEPHILAAVARGDRRYAKYVLKKMRSIGILEVMMGKSDWEKLGVSRQGGQKALARVVSKQRILFTDLTPKSRSAKYVARQIRRGGLKSPRWYRINRRAIPRES
jgi:hypothetical protein